MISVTLPLMLESTNVMLRLHYAVRMRKTALQRGQTRAHLFAPCSSERADLRTGTPVKIVATITRIAPRKLDSDNLQGAAKACRDAVADALGVNDADPRVTWFYAQEKARTPGVRITVEVVT